jgi:hypothetical protein
LLRKFGRVTTPDGQAASCWATCHRVLSWMCPAFPDRRRDPNPCIGCGSSWQWHVDVGCKACCLLLGCIVLAGILVSRSRTSSVPQSCLVWLAVAAVRALAGWRSSLRKSFRQSPRVEVAGAAQASSGSARAVEAAHGRLLGTRSTRDSEHNTIAKIIRLRRGSTV